ncbi:MAG: deoxyguanosinetriphosphate triphosphohydrolase [Wolinella sp.]
MQPSERFYPVCDDFRDPYSRDRDRIIHCSSFRRLEYKTQVFLNSSGDYFRTRLTHSIEVSQIARSLAAHLGLNEALAEAIALAHDLGHTPFGHAGGDELDKLLKKGGFPAGFDHNFQSFRVVSKLEKRYAAFDGLNLTFATLEGILKHSFPYKKAFLDERMNELFKLEYHPSLEAIIVDYADEIAYVSHDIDDGIKCGLLCFEDLKESELAREILHTAELEGIREDEKVLRYRFVSNLISHLIYRFLDASKAHANPSHQVLSASIPAGQQTGLGYPKELERELKVLKKLLFKKLYRHEQINRKMFFGRGCIAALFADFMNEPNLLPKELQERISEGAKPHRMVADYIASMSDRYAINLYKELHIG